MINRLRTSLTYVLNLNESTQRTALAFSVGVVIAFSPTYGLHTLTAFFCAWAFRLNLIALMTGAFINNPWTVVPILGLTFWTGFKLTNTPYVAFSWDDLSLQGIYDQAIPYALSFFAGGIALSLLGGLLSYPLAYYLISRYRVRRDRKSLGREPLPPNAGLR